MLPASKYNLSRSVSWTVEPVMVQDCELNTQLTELLRPVGETSSVLDWLRPAWAWTGWPSSCESGGDSGLSNMLLFVGC